MASLLFCGSFPALAGVRRLYCHPCGGCLTRTENGLVRRPPRFYSWGAMKGYGQFCPVAKACEIVAERWTPLVLRELLCGSTRFSELQRGVPLMSRTLLAQRLRELEDAGVVASAAKTRGRGREYWLTD